ncbi:MAG: hypothetical protein E7043_02965 [Lentisphaerae bacterium]|nr:hypothetical protein [Lentisphaerota bacterium]
MNFSGQIGAKRYRTRLRPLWRIGQYIALADLFFLLVFFLLLASSVVRISGIRVNLPQAEKVPQAVGLGKAIVSVTPPDKPGLPCRIYFRDRHIDAAQLRRELLTDIHREKVLVIRADKDVPSGVLYEIMNIAESARMESFIAVQPLKEHAETRFVE